MLTEANPKLPMRNAQATRDYYIGNLGFGIVADHGDYLILRKEGVELHFFLFKGLKPRKNYGQVYIRTREIEATYRDLLERGVPIHPNGPLEDKPWGQREFALLDPDYNLLTFGESIG